MLSALVESYLHPATSALSAQPFAARGHGALCVLNSTTDTLNVGCKPSDVPAGGLALTDGVRKAAANFGLTVELEIAMLGRNGLYINDPDDNYTLKALPGKFSGLRRRDAHPDSAIRSQPAAGP